MSTVRTFSREFPAYHSTMGQTYFVEKMLNVFDVDYKGEGYLKKLRELNPDKSTNVIFDFWTSLAPLPELHQRKGHTIRAGMSLKPGDLFSPRVWSGKPYRSTQITFHNDIEVVKTWDFSIEDKEVKIDGNEAGLLTIQDVANNDGLSFADLILWFKYPTTFKGQIICWDKTIEY